MKNVNKKLKIILIGFLILTFIGQVFLFVYLGELRSNFDQGMSIRGTNTIFFMADGYSESDFLGVKDYLNQWQGKVIIAGISENLTTNKSVLISDILLSDIDDITTYDAIVIPGGKQTSILTTDLYAIDLLKAAYDQGLVITGIGNGTLVQANAGLINGKKFTTYSPIVTNLTAAGGTYINGATVVTDDNIITAVPPNYEEISYAIANAMGYSYTLEVDISFEKEDDGWNYSLTVEPSDKHIVSNMIINLSLVDSTDEKTLVKAVELVEEEGVYITNFGILANGFYVIDITVESIYGNIEVRTAITEFSVGSN